MVVCTHLNCPLLCQILPNQEYLILFTNYEGLLWPGLSGSSKFLSQISVKLTTVCSILVFNYYCVDWWWQYTDCTHLDWYMPRFYYKTWSYPVLKLSFSMCCFITVTCLVAGVVVCSCNALLRQHVFCMLVMYIKVTNAFACSFIACQNNFRSLSGWAKIRAAVWH